MEHLKLAWFYRFWIVVGVVALMPIIGYFVDTSKVARTADARKRVLETTKNNLQTKLKGPFPNEQWVTGVNQRKDELNVQVEGAWIELYKRQEHIRTFPKEVQQTFLDAGPKPKEFPVQTLVRYQQLFADQIKEIIRSLEPAGPLATSKSKGLVQVPNPEFLLGYVPRGFLPIWATPDFPTPPKPEDAWIAQEDIWILRAMVEVVTRANKNAETWAEAPVKRILDLQRGRGAADLSVTMSKTATPNWSGPEDIIDNLAGRTKEEQERFIRYLNKNKLFKPVPVYMELCVAQKDILPVLAEFGNSDVPMEIKQVEVAQASEPTPIAKAAPGATAKEKEAVEEIGEVIRKADEYFHLTNLKIHARAYLYQKPPKIEEEEKAAKAGATAAATQPAGAGN